MDGLAEWRDLLNCNWEFLIRRWPALTGIYLDEAMKKDKAMEEGHGAGWRILFKGRGGYQTAGSCP